MLTQNSDLQVCGYLSHGNITQLPRYCGNSLKPHQKNEKTWTIVGAPHRLYNSTLVNTVSNAHRGVWVKNGREADADHQQRQVKRLKTNSGAPNTATTTNMDMATAVMSSTAADAVVSAPDTSQANARMHLLPGPQRKVRKSKYTSDSPVGKYSLGNDFTTMC
jgi:hypothetical protein